MKQVYTMMYGQINIKIYVRVVNISTRCVAKIRRYWVYSRHSVISEVVLLHGNTSYSLLVNVIEALFVSRTGEACP